VTVAAKSGQFTAGKTGKGQFLWGNRWNLAEERVVRKISSPSKIASVPYHIPIFATTIKLFFCHVLFLQAKTEGPFSPAPADVSCRIAITCLTALQMSFYNILFWLYFTSLISISDPGSLLDF